MGDDKPRLTRLMAILTQLQSSRLLTASEIAERHDISIRTVYRDIRTLGQSGVPIITVEGKGYSIMDGYKLPPVKFTQDEANAIITAAHLILKNKDLSLVKHYESAVTKIKATLGSSQQARTELLSERIQVRNNFQGEKNSHFLIQLQTTISDAQVVRIDYLSLNHQYSKREIEPFALYTKSNWVLIAFCRKRKDFRTFRLDCIQSLHVTDERFSPHGITLEEYLKQCSDNWKDTPDIPLT